MNPNVPAAEADFAILGAGAIGTILGAHLARAGHRVVMLVRETRAGQILADGLRITGLADFSIPVCTLRDPAQLRRARILIVAMKTPGTAAVLAALRHVELEMAFSIQNGPQKNELLRAIFGAPAVLGAIADISGEMSADGHVTFTRNVNILLGELSGEATARSSALAQLIASAGVRSAAVAHIESLEWSKFVVWVGLLILSVTTRAPTWCYLSDPDGALALVRLAREMALLCESRGIALTDHAVLPAATLCTGSEAAAVQAVLRAGADFQRNAPTHRMSSLQDLQAGRPLEIHETLGLAVHDARARGLAVPLLDACYRIVSAIDRGARNWPVS
ncbi:MAG TPA: 2-dehydropantoate 2-reductase [Steroidobacteraceae bacterium]